MNTKQNPYGVKANSSSTAGQSASTATQFAIEKNNGFALTALIFGILSFPLSFLAAIPGVIFGHIALSKVKHFPDEYAGRGMAIWGLVLSYLFLIFYALIIGVFVYFYFSYPEFKEEFNRGFSYGLEQDMSSLQYSN